MDAGIIPLVIVLGLLALFLGLFLFGLALRGGAFLFFWALEQGFIGVAAYFAAWVFLLPLMATVSIGLGIGLKTLERREIQDKNRVEKGVPPRSPDAHYRWANRLPPYDD